jgi:hypothetical protein
MLGIEDSLIIDEMADMNQFRDPKFVQMFWPTFVTETNLDEEHQKWQFASLGRAVEVGCVWWHIAVAGKSLGGIIVWPDGRVAVEMCAVPKWGRDIEWGELRDSSIELDNGHSIPFDGGGI